MCNEKDHLNTQMFRMYEYVPVANNYNPPCLTTLMLCVTSANSPKDDTNRDKRQQRI